MTGVGMTLIFCWLLGCFVCFRRGKQSNYNNNSKDNNNSSYSIESTSRVMCVSLIAFWELLASGTSSLLMSQNIFDPTDRGLTIVLLSSSTIVVRIVQITYYKCKLSNIASKEQMIVENTKLLDTNDDKTESHDDDNNTNKSYDKHIEMAIQLQSFEVNNNNNDNNNNNMNNHQNYRHHVSNMSDDYYSPSNDYNGGFDRYGSNSSQPQMTSVESNNNYNINNSGSVDMTSINNMSEELQNETNEFKKRTKERKKLKEEEASQLMNYNFALYFISFSTFTDASFDIIQGIILLFGFTSTTQPLAVLGSLIGFSTEIMDFFEGMTMIACNNYI